MKKIVSAFLTVAVLLGIALSSPCEAKGGTEHREDLKKVLFGKSFVEEKASENTVLLLNALDAAAYLAIDQYNAEKTTKGSNALKLLQDCGVKGLPDSVADIDFKGNEHHRKFTHRGWEYQYTDDKGKWEIRKKILLNTVSYFFEFDTVSNSLSGFDEQCDSFCALIYDVHILGDRASDDKYKSPSDEMTIYSRAGDTDQSVGIIQDLKQRCSTLFSSQAYSKEYLLLMRDINKFERKFKKLESSKGLYDDTTIADYRELADNLLNSLEKHIPRLLKKEDFWNSASAVEQYYDMAA